MAHTPSPTAAGVPVTTRVREPAAAGTTDPAVDAVLETLADDDVRLLSLVGPGGVGKTRLATAVTRALKDAGAAVAVVELPERPDTAVRPGAPAWPDTALRPEAAVRPGAAAWPDTALRPDATESGLSQDGRPRTEPSPAGRPEAGLPGVGLPGVGLPGVGPSEAGSPQAQDPQAVPGSGAPAPSRPAHIGPAQLGPPPADLPYGGPPPAALAHAEPPHTGPAPLDPPPAGPSHGGPPPHTGLARIEAALRSEVDGGAVRYVVVENLHHLGDEVRQLGPVLDAHPDVTVLATTRAASRISAEHVRRVEPLAVPDGPAAEAGSAAVALFLRGARRVACQADLDARDQTVAAICARLGGLPLALIIAAEQLRSMTAEALLARLRDGWSPVMRGPADLPDRHARLVRVLDDSLAGLSPAGRALFRLLGVFQGRIDYDAVADVLAYAAAGTTGGPAGPGAPGPGHTPGTDHTPDPDLPGPDALWDGIQELVAHSLLTPVTEAGTGVAFQMSATTRDHARRLFAGAPGNALLRRAHADHYARRILIGHHVYGADAEEWGRGLGLALDDVRGALRLHLDAKDPAVLDLVAALRGFWLAKGLFQEALGWLNEALALPVEPTDPARLRALETRAALTGAARSYAHALDDLQECADGWAAREEPAAGARARVDLAAALCEVHGFDRARPVYEEAIATLDEAGDRWWAARARSLYGASAAASKDHRELAMPSLDRAVEEFRGIGESAYSNVPLQQLGRILHEDGHRTQAAALLAEGLSLARQAGDAWNESIFLNLLAEVEFSQGHSVEAGAHYADSLRLAEQIGARPRFLWCLDGLAACLDDIGETHHAARLTGLAESLRSALNLHGWVELPAREIDLSGIRSRLSRTLYTALRAEGALMTVGDVLESAPALLTTKRAPTARERRRNRFPDGLTSREAEVLRLIASGATSRAIASELFISIETVGRHISNIYRKTGISGRAEAAAYAIRSGVLED